MPDCKACEHKHEPLTTEEELRYAHDVTTAFAERTVKRLWVIIILLIALFVGSNAMWIYYDKQHEEVVVTQENADGYNNFVGNDGDILNGETND